MEQTCVPPTCEVDGVDQHHGRVRVQVLHHVFDHVSCFTCNVTVDLSCSVIRFIKIDVEDLGRVVLLDFVHVTFQRIEALVHCSSIAKKQLLVALVFLKHVEEMLVRFINLCLVESAVAQSGEQLTMSFLTGPIGQHGQAS